MELSQQIASVLIELKQASLSIQGTTSKQDWDSIMNRYNLRFMGAKFNEIYSDELVQTLSDKFDIPIDLETLNKMLPEICVSLGMTALPLTARSDLGQTVHPIHSFIIHLH